MRWSAPFVVLALGAFVSAQDEPRAAAEWGSPFPLITIQSEHGYFEVDFLRWYLKQLNVPPLVTSGPLGGSGTVGDPATVVLRGGDSLRSRHGRYVGVRPSGEYWFGDEPIWGVQGSATILERDSSNLTYRQDTNLLLARPYIDAATGQQRAIIVAGHDPVLGDLSGSVNVYSRIEFFAEDASAMVRVLRGEAFRVNALAGACFLQMRERLDVTNTSRIKPAEAVLLGTADHFQTFDKFYGGQMGLSGEMRFGRWTLDAKGLLALGADEQQIRAKGDRVIHTPAGRETRDYGLYVLPSNTGTFDRTALDFVTEWSANLGFRLTNHMRARVGYTLITWNNPVRPGDQLGPLNLSQIAPGSLTGPLAPTIPFRTASFWAQGLNLGLDVNW